MGWTWQQVDNIDPNPGWDEPLERMIMTQAQRDACTLSQSNSNVPAIFTDGHPEHDHITAGTYAAMNDSESSMSDGNWAEFAWEGGHIDLTGVSEIVMDFTPGNYGTRQEFEFYLDGNKITGHHPSSNFDNYELTFSIPSQYQYSGVSMAFRSVKRSGDWPGIVGFDNIRPKIFNSSP